MCNLSNCEKFCNHRPPGGWQSQLPRHSLISWYGVPAPSIHVLRKFQTQKYTIHNISYLGGRGGAHFLCIFIVSFTRKVPTFHFYIWELVSLPRNIIYLTLYQRPLYKLSHVEFSPTKCSLYRAYLSEELDRVGPIDNRLSTDQIHPFVKKK